MPYLFKEVIVNDFPIEKVHLWWIFYKKIKSLMTYLWKESLFMTLLISLKTCLTKSLSEYFVLYVFLTERFIIDQFFFYRKFLVYDFSCRKVHRLWTSLVIYLVEKLIVDDLAYRKSIADYISCKKMYVERFSIDDFFILYKSSALMICFLEKFTNDNFLIENMVVENFSYIKPYFFIRTIKN